MNKVHQFNTLNVLIFAAAQLTVKNLQKFSEINLTYTFVSSTRGLIS